MQREQTCGNPVRPAGALCPQHRARRGDRDRPLALRGGRRRGQGHRSLGGERRRPCGRARTLRARIASGADPDSAIVPVFALAAEASRRRLGLRPYDEQLVAGAAMHRGRAVQVQTGEGKTLAAVFPACLDAMTGEGVHVLTANDYLARRDAEWMRPVYEALGVSVASIGERTDPAARRAAYRADVTYLTAREAGFDHLRDGLACDAASCVQREPCDRHRRRGGLPAGRRGPGPARHRGLDRCRRPRRAAGRPARPLVLTGQGVRPGPRGPPGVAAPGGPSRSSSGPSGSRESTRSGAPPHSPGCTRPCTRTRCSRATWTTW